ncbi:hypothetical protein [Streptomyces sp. NBC_01334]|uniref:hypothetical protein n=1 Tax=Streptomyces sp. NBC_01334 TaxID=2903827 RepID=UPI002E148A4C|nr:hypothetical protein OG736_41620 [Streptomyces sp. NBC_01334]
MTTISGGAAGHTGPSDEREPHHPRRDGVPDRSRRPLAGSVHCGPGEAVAVAVAVGEDHRLDAVEPALVCGAYALFEAAWETATELAAFFDPDRPRIDARAREVLSRWAPE